MAFFHCANILIKHFPVPYLNNKDIQESWLDAYWKNIYTRANIAYRFFGIRSACVQPARKSFLSYKVLVLSISQIFILIEMLVIQMPFYKSLTKSFCSFWLIGWSELWEFWETKSLSSLSIHWFFWCYLVPWKMLTEYKMLDSVYNCTSRRWFIK